MNFIRIMYNEAKFQTEFGHWVKANKWSKQGLYELKICKEKRFNLKKIAKHQLNNLHMVKHGCFYYKISDYSIDQKPGDCVILYKGYGYLVLMFYRPRETKSFYMIDIDKILALIKVNSKSITENEASVLADCIGILKN